MFPCPGRSSGIPKGFCFLAYKDQRSTILAVDNANGMKLLKNTLRVDHCKNYRPPRTEGENDDEEPVSLLLLQPFEGSSYTQRDSAADTGVA